MRPSSTTVIFTEKVNETDICRYERVGPVADGGDPNHEAALLFQGEIAGQCLLVVTDYVLDELYTLLLMNVGYQRAVDFKHKLDILVKEEVLEVIWASKEVAAEVWSVFEKFNVDKHWSFTDCVSYW